MSMTSSASPGPISLVSLTRFAMVPIIIVGRARSHEQGACSALKTAKIRVKNRQNEGPRDAVDERLIALLRTDARMKLTALSRAVSLSRTAVQARIARLERDEVILGYCAVIREAGDEDGLRAILSLVFRERPCHPVVKKFRAWPEIVNYYSVTGPVDGYALVKVRDAQALAELVDRFSGLAGIASASSAVMLRSD
jgi:DNA-binding Lrp family transcriptional regulator